MRRELRTLRGVDVRGKRVLVRVDCNIAVDEDSRPLADTDQRLRAILPTLTFLRAEGARIILLSHLGRPRGRPVEALRLDDVARRLGVLLGAPVRYVPDIAGSRALAVRDALRDGDILMLENLRFDPGEEKANPTFARLLAAMGDLVVQDAFADAHRLHASVALLPRLLPSYAGLLVEREVSTLQQVLERPARPFVAITGGVKLETKLALLRNLLPRVDHLLTGGGIANTLLRLRGAPGAAGLAESDRGELTSLLQEFHDKIVLPQDVRVRRAGERMALLVLVSALRAADEILDVGPETTAAYCQILQRAKTCIWNGPVGKFEDPQFREGTKRLAMCLAASTAFSVVGGGDTVRALTEMGLVDRFSHVSTGGGALLAYLEGAPMPGLEPLYKEMGSERADRPLGS